MTTQTASTSSSSSTSASSSSSSSSSSTSTSAPLYPVANTDFANDPAAQAIEEAKQEEQRLQKQIDSAKNDRERKLLQLKLKMSAGRRANAEEVKSESERIKGGEETGRRKEREWKTEKEKEKEKDKDKADADTSPAYLHETALSAESHRERLADKASKKAGFGWEVFNQDAQYNAYEKRLAKLPENENANDEKNFRDANSLDYATVSNLPLFHPIVCMACSIVLLDVFVCGLIAVVISSVIQADSLRYRAYGE